MYAGSSASTDRTIRLGRLTSFNHDRGYAIAEGLRDLWVIGGDGSRRMMGIPHFARIRFG
jgi:hypothetical protein